MRRPNHSTVVGEIPKSRGWSAFRTGATATGRVEAFSDCVIAVAITLLILNIQIPRGMNTDAELWHGVVTLLSALFAWVVSFAFILTFWVHHHYFFASLKCTDRGLLWLNGLFLLMIALLPFPVGLMADYPLFAAPVVLLSAVMLLASVSFTAMRFYASFPAKLLREEMTPTLVRRAMWTSIGVSLVYGVLLAVAFVLPRVAIASQGLLLIVFFMHSPDAHSQGPKSTHM